MHDGSQVLV
jgi:hypothetical protein